MALRFTKDVVQQLLDMNDGFKASTSYVAKNFSESRTYVIENGALLVRAVGKTSWADSRFDTLTKATLEEARRFLKNHIQDLKTGDLGKP